jgi:hypothetical protein
LNFKMQEFKLYGLINKMTDLILKPIILVENLILLFNNACKR